MLSTKVYHKYVGDSNNQRKSNELYACDYLYIKNLNQKYHEDLKKFEEELKKYRETYIKLKNKR
jgi:hypothetical protein